MRLRLLHHRPFACRSGLIPLVFIVAGIFSGCGERVAADAQVAGQTNRESSAAESILSFDLPKGYWDKDEHGAFVVTGFSIGYFRPNDDRPLVTIDLPREAVSTQGSTGQLSLPPYVPEAGVTTVVVRMRTLSRSGASAWSAPPESGPAGPAVTRSPGAQTSRRPRGVSMTDLESHPRLLAAARALVPGDEAIRAVILPFRNVTEFALAVVMCRTHGKSLEKLALAMQGPPRRSLRRAMREIDLGSKGANVLAAARAEAQQLVGKAPEQD